MASNNGKKNGGRRRAKGDSRGPAIIPRRLGRRRRFPKGHARARSPCGGARRPGANPAPCRAPRRATCPRACPVTPSHRRPGLQRWLAPVQRHPEVVEKGARHRARLLPPEESPSPRGPRSARRNCAPLRGARFGAAGRRETASATSRQFVRDGVGQPPRRRSPRGAAHAAGAGPGSSSGHGHACRTDLICWECLLCRSAMIGGDEDIRQPVTWPAPHAWRPCRSQGRPRRGQRVAHRGGAGCMARPAWWRCSARWWV
jgi:hypothetical protein